MAGRECGAHGGRRDELMAGYSFVYNLGKEELGAQLRRLWGVMTFSSVPLAESLGIEARTPFLDPDFAAYAMEMDPACKVGEEAGQVYGKFILRKAFEGMLPREITWRAKTPIEAGSGTADLPRFFGSRIGGRRVLGEEGALPEGGWGDHKGQGAPCVLRGVPVKVGAPRPQRAGRRARSAGLACRMARHSAGRAALFQFDNNILLSLAPDGATFCRTCGAVRCGALPRRDGGIHCEG